MFYLFILYLRKIFIASGGNIHSPWQPVAGMFMYIYLRSLGTIHPYTSVSISPYTSVSISLYTCVFKGWGLFRIRYVRTKFILYFWLR